MKLVMYSGGCNKLNEKIDREFVKILREKCKGRRPRITYIPSSSWGMEEYFNEFKDYYKKYSLTKIQCFPVDSNFSKAELRRAFSADAIYLSGGNTFYFLKTLQDAKLLPLLRAFVKRGGILMGLSAGSILMTPSIHTAKIPSHDRDENDVRLKNLVSLGLVKFEFSPHYVRRKKSDAELLRYSKKVFHPIYAFDDGDGIIINGDTMVFIGKTHTFYRGQKFTQP